jgi:hypothetical protein
MELSFILTEYQFQFPANNSIPLSQIKQTILNGHRKQSNYSVILTKWMVAL